MRPRVVVHSGLRAPDQAPPILHVLARRAEVRGPGFASADVELVFGVDAPRLGELLTGTAPVVAVCTGDGARSWSERFDAPALGFVLGDDVDGWRTLDLDAIDGDAYPPRSPHVRERLRAIGVDGGLATRPATAVELAEARPALALATPCVMSAETARALGAEDGVHVVVAAAADTERAVAELVDDRVRAAAVSTNGRRLFERRHDLSTVARLTCGLARRPNSASDRVRLELDRLGTPPTPSISKRALRITA